MILTQERYVLLRSVVSELQTLLRNVLVWCGMLVRLVRTFKQRTDVPYPYLRNKRTVLFSKN